MLTCNRPNEVQCIREDGESYNLVVDSNDMLTNIGRYVLSNSVDLELRLMCVINRNKLI